MRTSQPKCLLMLLFALTLPARSPAMITTGKGNAPVEDRNWPAGALAVANLSSRVGWWEGPPFGGGQWHFQYRGDAGRLNEALARFAQIRAPRLLVVVHKGPGSSIFLKDSADPKSDPAVDWELTLWDPQSFHQLYNNPASFFSAQHEDFRSECAPPQLDVYASTGRLDWSLASVPPNITVSDERTTVNGYTVDDGSVVRGVAYDMITSKPISGATVSVEYLPAPPATEVPAGLKGSCDADGKFEIKHLRPGTWRVVIQHDGHASRMLGHIEIKTQTLKTFTTHLAPAVAGELSVVDAAGKPVADVTVRLSSAIGYDGRGYSLAQELKAVTDTTGRATFQDLPLGYAQFFVSAKGYQPIDILKLHTLAPKASVQLRVTLTGALHGRVKLAPGQSAANVHVHVQPEDGEVVGKWSGSSQIKPDGTFQFDQVTPGKYRVSADPRMMVTGSDPNAVTVTIEAGKTAEVQVQAPPPPARRPPPRRRPAPPPADPKPAEEPL